MGYSNSSIDWSFDFVVTYSKDIDYARGISYSVQKLTQLGAWGYVAEGIIAAIVTVIGMPILMYACLSIGQLLY